VFPVRYELNSYILFRRNSVFKGLMTCKYKNSDVGVTGINFLAIVKLEINMMPLLNSPSGYVVNCFSMVPSEHLRKETITIYCNIYELQSLF
jgi:hypothetical protein